MILEKFILNLVLGFLNGITFFVKVRSNRITFISMTNDHLTSDFQKIDQALQKEGIYDIHYNLMKIHKSVKGYFLYFINLCGQLVQIKKSALVILNDNNYIVSKFKPKKTKVLQVWHATGAIKKFGNQIQRSYAISGYDAILCSAPYWKPVYAQAFGVAEDKVKVTGMPRIDILLKDAHKEEFLKKHPECRHKKCILYAPTFRGNMVHGLKQTSFDIKAVLDKLGEEVCILYKFHPLLPDIQIEHQRAIDVHDEDLYTLMHVSDALVSDYSSVILDYSLLRKPMVAYIDDLEEYSSSVGLNIDYTKEFPGPICYDQKTLVQALSNLKTDEKLDEFQKKYIVHNDGENTSRVIRVIHEMMNS